MLGQSSVNPTIYYFNIDKKVCTNRLMAKKNSDQAIGHALEVRLSGYSDAPFTPDAKSDLYSKVNAETTKVN